MRAFLLPAAATLLAFSLSGCFWWSAGMGPGHGYDPAGGDLAFPLALLGLLLIGGFALLIANYAKDATDRPSPPPPPKPPSRPAEAPPAPERGEDKTPRKAPSRSAKARREKP